MEILRATLRRKKGPAVHKLAEIRTIKKAGAPMKRIFSVLPTIFILLILTPVLFGCAEWNVARVEQKYGPPAKKETVDEKIFYQYFFSLRNWDTFKMETWRVDITFDKDGKLVKKREFQLHPYTLLREADPLLIEPWLRTLSGGAAPEIDVTGNWTDRYGTGFHAWGNGTLRQEQEKVTGDIGDYQVKGIVSGKTVYLIFLSEGTVYYSARLELVKDSLAGNYFGPNDRQQKSGAPMSLIKAEEKIK